MLSLHTLHRPQRLQRGWIWLCVVSLLAFQVLGLVHRSLHGGSLPAQLRLAMQAQSLRASVGQGIGIGIGIGLGLELGLRRVPTQALARSADTGTVANGDGAVISSSGRWTPGGADTAGTIASTADVPGPVDTAGARFGHAAGSTDCQLLDQLGQALGPIVQAMAWTALLPDGPVATPQPHSAPLARVWRLPARAPPLA
ncbi:hypothetical protein [Roseateles amylovorans]|uniref:Uncharacterized protein n=1 Tax=Roseateles amylovorans TaxID=2978473 RepID=A0ABY6B7K6_9BURK|nr:hypothetical protein [Roseateles amylovorans]UXH80318.1 hypothetical protein N4261_10760 [Roseateles amylovorans]